MIRVLLADDDYLLKDMLLNSIPWKELDMEVIDFVENGKQALDLCLSQKPALLITDIRMPIMNGLEVALYLREHQIKTHVVLISGISDFEYARTALDVQASGYLLKPIRVGEIIATLKKVRESIELESNREAFLNSLTTRLQDNIPLARASFLRSLLRGKPETAEKLEEKLEYFQLPFRPGESVVVVVGSVDHYASLSANYNVKDFQMIHFAIGDIISQSLQNYQAGIFIDMQENEFVLLFNRRYSSINKITPILEDIAELIKKLDHITISFGIGMPVSGIYAVSSSYYEARKALDYRFYIGNQSIIPVDDIITPTALTSEDLSQQLQTFRKLLFKKIKLGDTDSVTLTLEKYYQLLSAESLSKEYIRGLFFELIIRSYQEFCETENDQPTITTKFNQISLSVLNSETIHEIYRNTKIFLLAITEHLSEKYTNRQLALVNQIKDFIYQHRIENITLSDIAQAVYLSPSYISAIFKKEAGQTIHDYMLSLKMQEAKKLLSETHMKILEISEYLGYETPHYFSYSFKRYTGQTPGQYRQEISKVPE